MNVYPKQQNDILEKDLESYVIFEGTEDKRGRGRQNLFLFTKLFKEVFIYLFIYLLLRECSQCSNVLGRNYTVLFLSL